MQREGNRYRELVEGTPFYHKDGKVEIFDYKAVNSYWISAEGTRHGAWSGMKKEIKVGDIVRFNGESEIIGIVTYVNETGLCMVMSQNGETEKYPKCVLEGSRNYYYTVQEFLGTLERLVDREKDEEAKNQSETIEMRFLYTVGT